jgi:hypothetical protein
MSSLRRNASIASFASLAPQALRRLDTLLRGAALRAGAAMVTLSAGNAFAQTTQVTAPPEMTPVPPLGGQPLPRRERGVYGFDGTGASQRDGTVIVSFVRDARAQRKGYFRGTTLDARNYGDIVRAGVTEICAQHRRVPFDEVFLTGWSRGAVAALHVAAGIESTCGIKPRWVGIVDAVQTTVESSYDVGNRERSLFDTRCVHAVKGEGTERRPFLATSRYVGCSQTELPGDHSQIATSTETLNFLRGDAQRIAPDMFGGAPRQSGALEDIGDLRTCLQRRGTWENGLCTESQPDDS